MARIPLSTSVLRTLTSAIALDANRHSVAVQLGALLHARPVHLTGLRIEDFLSLDFFLYNMRLKKGDAPVAERRDPAKPAFLVAQFQGQAFGEQAYGWTGNPDSSETPAKPPATLAQAILAGPSRLAFRMPNLTTELPLSLVDFLDACRNWPMSLGSLAAPLPPNYSDDLPTGSVFDRITDFIGLSGAAVASVLAGARFADLRLGFAEALAGERRGAAERAAGLAARPVLARLRRELTGGMIDGAALGAFAGEQVKAATAAAGLGAADRTMVRALLDLTIAEEMARPGVVAGNARVVAEYFKIPGLIQLFLKPHKPPLTVTALELPYRLYQSPIEPAGWTHTRWAASRGRGGRNCGTRGWPRG